MTSDGIGPKGPGGALTSGRGIGAEIGDEAASVIELTGVIKWFDVSKGYGFIVPDNGMPDILLHVTCLRRDGFQVAYEGARVVVEVLQRPRGLQAFRVVSMDESTAVHPAQMPPPRTHVTVTPTSGLERAQVKWFNRGYARHFRAYGDVAPVRPGRIAAGPVCAGALWTRPEGIDGGRGAPRRRPARSGLALTPAKTRCHAGGACGRPAQSAFSAAARPDLQDLKSLCYHRRASIEALSCAVACLFSSPRCRS